MPEAICPKCGEKYHGWALVHKPEDNFCDICHTELEVVEGSAKA
ncbi:MAG: hypothetical protein ABII97_02990 [Patescibacteria group bacterium]